MILCKTMKRESLGDTVQLGWNMLWRPRYAEYEIRAGIYIHHATGCPSRESDETEYNAVMLFSFKTSFLFRYNIYHCFMILSTFLSMATGRDGLAGCLCSRRDSTPWTSEYNVLLQCRKPSEQYCYDYYLVRWYTVRWFY